MPDPKIRQHVFDWATEPTLKTATGSNAFLQSPTLTKSNILAAMASLKGLNFNPLTPVMFMMHPFAVKDLMAIDDETTVVVDFETVEQKAIIQQWEGGKKWADESSGSQSYHFSYHK